MERFAEEHQNAAVNGFDEVEEEVEDEVEEEVEEEEGEEEDDDRSGDGDGGEEGGEHQGTRIDNVDGAGEDTKAPSSGKIFVGGVAWETTEEIFTKHFEKYGAITDSVIMKDKHTRMPRGFGFVTFADPSVIDKLLEDEHVIDGRTVEVKRTVPKDEMSSKDGPKTRKIFVGGIPSSLTEDDLKEHFSTYGKVVEHMIMLDHSTRRSRGFGFVTFESEDAVEKVISEGRMHDLGGKQVEIKKAEPKKAGGDVGSNGRVSYGSASYRGSHRGSAGTFGYGGGYQSGGTYYGGGAGGAAGYGYGRGYGYGGGSSLATGFGSGYGGAMYGGGGGSSLATGFGSGYGGAMYGGGGHGAYGGGAYGMPGGYGGAYGGGYGGGRGYGRYHPYGK